MIKQATQSQNISGEFDRTFLVELQNDE
uniref:Uncharacterized protein n=1 Tax=Anguilla anguilla TaxID=7936 RepID=A0A0E9RRL3_ANGAN